MRTLKISFNNLFKVTGGRVMDWAKDFASMDLNADSFPIFKNLSACKNSLFSTSFDTYDWKVVF